MRDWPDGAVLYDEANGEMQRLNTAAARVMDMFLQNSEWNSEQLTRALFGDAPAPEDFESVASMLANFQSLHLIDRAPD